MRKVLLGLLAVLLVAAGAAYLFRRELMLFAVGAMGKEEIAANRPVAWMQGPDEASAPPAERPPNVIVILADDLGINDVSIFGGGVIATPHIDALARGGANLTRGYSGTAACAPSRAMIMTGRYPTRHGFEFTPTPGGMGRALAMMYNDGSRPHPMIFDAESEAALPPMAEQGLPGEEITLAEVLKTRGYHTVHIGKWHLGDAGEFRPNAQGFDESLILASALYLPENDPGVVNAKLSFDPIDRFLWARMQYAAAYNGGEKFEPKGYLTDYYTDEAVKVIAANRNRPFFLYLAHWGVHTPLQASKADYDALSHIQDHRLRVYAAMIRALDRSVGKVAEALEANGLAENTIVIFSSDNGAPGYIGLPHVNEPYRGWKLTFFEGGIRVPFFIRWPARIEPGTTYEGAVSHLDMLPTLAAAAGAQPPADRPIDGVDLLPLVADGGRPATPRTLFWQDGHYLAVQHEGWKLQTSERPKKDWLFDLNTDPTEQNNLAERRPEKVAELKALIAAHRRGGRTPLYPYAGEVPVTVDKTLEQKATADDEYVYWPG